MENDEASKAETKSEDTTQTQAEDEQQQEYETYTLRQAHRDHAANLRDLSKETRTTAFIAFLGGAVLTGIGVGLAKRGALTTPGDIILGADAALAAFNYGHGAVNLQHSSSSNQRAAAIEGALIQHDLQVDREERAAEKLAAAETVNQTPEA